MFTLEQIEKIHSKVKSGKDFPQYVKNLEEIGISYYNIYVEDGHAEYYGREGEYLISPASYPILEIAENGDADILKEALRIHQAGKTDYLTFCKDAAQAGVALWKTDVLNLKVTYFDKTENEIVSEVIPGV